MKRFFLCVALLIYMTSLEAKALDISAECACLINADTNVVIFEQNANTRHSMASTTKIMTAIIALEESMADEIVTVSHNASSQEGSSIYLKTGEQLAMEDLVMGMMLNSGNDAACAVAEHIGGTSDDFALMMTRKAKEIGAENTSFKNANGLDAKGHYSTAYDMAIIAAYGLKNEKFKEIVSTKNKEIDNGNSITYLKNHNKLLWNYDGCIGVKTGYTKKTGRCLVSAAERNGVTLVAVTLNAPDDWHDHTKMLDYGFEKMKRILVVKKNEVLKSFDYGLNAIARNDIYVTGNNKNSFEIVLHTIKNPQYDILKNEKIGYAEIKYKDMVVDKVDLLSDSDYISKINREEGIVLEIVKIIKLMLLNYSK